MTDFTEDGGVIVHQEDTGDGARWVVAYFADYVNGKMVGEPQFAVRLYGPRGGVRWGWKGTEREAYAMKERFAKGLDALRSIPTELPQGARQ